MNATTFKLRIDMVEVAAFQERLESLLKEADFSADLIHDLSLVCEEILVNIISYGYPSQKESGLIEVTVDQGTGREVRLEIKDNGQAFNPLAAPERDPDDEREGGWGIPMLKALTDAVSYRREEAYNVLSFTRSERDS